jgi:hypothetical protein
MLSSLSYLAIPFILYLLKPAKEFCKQITDRGEKERDGN